MRGIHKLLGIVVLTAVLLVTNPPVAAVAAPKFVPPVEAEISGAFDLSNGEFAAGGHRGIDYAVPVGTAVRATGAGTVSFAGNTPEGPYVTISHESGIKTTYSLGEISVAEGQAVAQGATLGSSGRGHGGDPLFHFGGLINNKYVDPLILLGEFDDITDLINLAELEGSVPEPRGKLAGAFGSPGLTAGISPAELAPLLPDPTAGFTPVGPGTASGGVVVPPIDSHYVAPKPPWEPIRPAPSGPTTLRGPPLPSKFFHDDFVGEGGVGDGPQFDPRTGMPLFNAPKLVERWWTELTPEERRDLIDEYPLEVGHLVGVPIRDRDQANRLALSRRIKELERRKRELDKQMWGFPEARSLNDRRTWLSKIAPELAGTYESYIGLSPWRRRMTALSRELAGAKNLKRQLAEVAKDKRNRLKRSDVYLMELDTSAGYGDGQAVVAFGDPTFAEHIGLVVPGINNTLLNVENPLGDAAALRSTVADNEGIPAMNRTSTVMWLGYDAPNGFLDATNKAEAREGADRLERFVDALRASHVSPAIRPGYSSRARRDPHIVGYGHSYGSVVSGMATKQGMDIDDVLLMGSPGGGAVYGSELASINRGIWAARTPDDPIRHLPPALGQDPMESDFGASYIPLDSTQSGHGGYYDRDSLGLENMAWLLSGRYDMIQGEADDD